MAQDRDGRREEDEADARPMRNRDITVNLTPEEVWRVRLAGRVFEACLKFWGAIVVGVVAATSLNWWPVLWHWLKGRGP